MIKIINVRVGADFEETVLKSETWYEYNMMVWALKFQQGSIRVVVYYEDDSKKMPPYPTKPKGINNDKSISSETSPTV